MYLDTSKLAPRVIVNEHDTLSKNDNPMVAPITLMFGFAPRGRTCEMVECHNEYDIYDEFGQPQSTPEKYFIDSAIRLVNTGATALMVRLPYDNVQSHEVKYVDYKVEEPIQMGDIVTGPQETETREKDDNGVTVLKEMHRIDHLMNQYQRIVQVRDPITQIGVHNMTNEDLINLELDPQDNLEENTFRIVDIRGQQYGTGSGGYSYTGIFPMIVTSPMALYYQQKIENSVDLDKSFNMIEVQDGIEVSTSDFRQSNPLDGKFKAQQSQIINDIDTQLNFDSETNILHRSESFQDKCVSGFPLINFLELNKLEKTNLKDIGLLVCDISWDADQQKNTLRILESYVGGLSGGINAIDRKINEKSKYIRMYKNLSIPQETDYFVINDQKMTSLGMQASECTKYINYKTSIIDPITFLLESSFSDVDSLHIDTILDAGLTSTAFAAYVAKNEDGESFFENNEVRTLINWSRNDYPIDEYIGDYALVWNKITRLFGDFIKNVRGDCVYIADGPRILNLERNYPIRNYTDMDNIELFNKYLPYFNGYTNNYVAKYFNWVYIEDPQQDNMGFWVPGSVVMGSQLSVNDKSGEIWYAPAGQQRGLITGAYDVSVKTKQYNQENDLLYQNNWNFFNVYQNVGVVVEGQKTLQTKKTSLDRLNTRRMVCWIKQQLRIISNRYKYEPHTTSIRNAYRNEIVELLREVQRTNGISDYKIICDTSNNTQESIDRHELYCKIGIKPIKAIEYIIIDLNIINGRVSMDDTKIVQG